eukprot:921124-Pyramimonas_sp.AAC.1
MRGQPPRLCTDTKYLLGISFEEHLDALELGPYGVSSDHPIYYVFVSANLAVSPPGGRSGGADGGDPGGAGGGVLRARPCGRGGAAGHGRPLG